MLHTFWKHVRARDNFPRLLFVIGISLFFDIKYNMFLDTLKNCRICADKEWQSEDHSQRTRNMKCMLCYFAFAIKLLSGPTVFHRCLFIFLRQLILSWLLTCFFIFYFDFFSIQFQNQHLVKGNDFLLTFRWTISFKKRTNIYSQCLLCNIW